MREWGSRYARLILDRCGYNKRKACRELGISYHTLRDYLKELPEHERGFTSDVERIRARRADLAAGGPARSQSYKSPRRCRESYRQRDTQTV
jgi:hypothetical protein